ncbi:anti-sigma factor family protein [Actinomadura keratinilytica]|uniref:Zf-HC2 domain-containing protein n=1 Tax=Actinomadura keratinilytica TaxID=547461 RepID=A0ABP7Z7H7_9ACTN
MTTGPSHIDVGAYALGLLEEPDRRAFEAHLSTCRPCHEELAVLRGVAAQLHGMPPIEDPRDATPVPPPPEAVTDLLRHRARKLRRGRVRRALVGVAAGVVLLAGAFGTGLTMSGGSGGGGAAAAGAGPSVRVVDGSVETLMREGRRVTASDPGTGVTGTVAMESKLWGSRVGLRLSKVRGPLQCELVAIDRAGRAHTVAGWSVPAKGYGVPGSPDPLTLQGGTALSSDEIARFEVRTIGQGGGRTLLTVPV